MVTRPTFSPPPAPATTDIPAAGPAVTFVVIGFNEQHSITSCLTAILGQDTTVPFQVVYVDDGSTDTTTERVAELYDPRLTVVALPTNQGRGAARRAGIAHAGPTHIAFVDADVVIPPHWLQTLWPHMCEHGAAGGIAVPDGDIATIARISGLTPKVVPHTGAVSGTNALIHRDVIRSVEFPHTRLGEDFRFVRDVHAAGWNPVSVPSVLVQHNENKTYRNHVRWMWQSGGDAASLLNEYREIRTPDRVWFLFAAAVIGAAITRDRRVMCAAAAIIPAAAAGHVATRLHLKPRWGTVKAVAAQTVGMGAYLAGRSAGAARLVTGTRR